MSPLMERLGVKYPLFQGGMAWVADGKLAASVSEAGGLGIIGSVMHLLHGLKNRSKLQNQ